MAPWTLDLGVRGQGICKNLQTIGDPEKLVPFLKRVGSHVSAFEFYQGMRPNFNLFRHLGLREMLRTEYKYSLPSMFSLLNPSCVVELILNKTPILPQELILIADTFTQLRKMDLSCGSLSCFDEEKQSMTESFSIFLQKFSSYGRLEYLRLISTFDSTHLSFEHIPSSLKILIMSNSKLNSRDLSHIGLRCHQLEELEFSVHLDVAREDVATLLQDKKLKNLQISALNYENSIFEMPFVDFSPTLGNSLQYIEGDCATAPVILRNIELGEFPALKSVSIFSDTITDEAVMALAKLPQLTDLSLTCEAISDQAVIPIIWNGILETLFVSGEQISDKVPRLALAQCKNLNELYVNTVVYYPIPNAEELLEIVHDVMDSRYGPNERPTSEHDPRIFRFYVNFDGTFPCKNVHMWLCLYKYVDIMDLISLEQVSRRFYETIRSMVWPKVCRIGWHQEHLVGQYREINEYQRLGNPNKLVAILKRVGPHVGSFQFNYAKYTQQYLELPQEQRGWKITEYEYSLPLMFSLLNPSCVVELTLYGTPIQAKELIFIADTFTQLRRVNFSYGSLTCVAEEKQSMTESFSIFLEKFSSYGRLEDLHIANNLDSTHLNFEHIPPFLKKLDLANCKLNSRDLSNIGLRCHQLEELIISVHPEVTRKDVATLFGGMKSEMLRTLLIRATYDSTFFEMPFVEFSPALRNGVEAIVGDRTTTPAILRNMELFDFPILLFVTLSSDIITDEALKVLAKFTRLWKLELDCEEITDQAVIPIIQHGTLQILSVSSRYITDKVPRLAIERCKRLRRLTIGKKYPIPNAEEILEMTHSVMDKRYGPDKRPTGEHDPRILRFSANRDTFECQNLHPWVLVNRY
ncbi:hypothetical protein Ddc_12595 [Ditylenchus destructor]|nr:hypothetical protein Ddc_12595 [Ditylenchus destructor]